jgi:hypothetical protein
VPLPENFTAARVADALTGRTIERSVRRIIKYGYLGSSKIYNFAYFANNYGWMYGSTIYIHGNIGSNADLGFQSSPTINGTLFAATNPDMGAAGVVKSGGSFCMPAKQTLSSYVAGPAGRTGTFPILPANPAYTEDSNFNGILNTGEDKNGNKIIDKIDFSLGYGGNQQIQTGQKPLDVPYLGDLQYFKDLANTYARPANPAIGDAGGQGGIVKQLKAPGLDPTNANNYNILINQTNGHGVYGDQAGGNGEGGQPSQRGGGGGNGCVCWK